jgi:hypothetical protein
MVDEAVTEGATLMACLTEEGGRSSYSKRPPLLTRGRKRTGVAHERGEYPHLLSEAALARDGEERRQWNAEGKGSGVSVSSTRELLDRTNEVAHCLSLVSAAYYCPPAKRP